MTQRLQGLEDDIPESSVTNVPVVPGQIISERYLIGKVIGEGGMGVVFAATHVGLGTAVAVKLIRTDMKRNPQAVERFLNEARIAASLKGEHIARVFDVGQLESGEPYLVMEQLEGVGLDAFIEERGPLQPSEAADIVLQACEGLAEAHAVALVHRDIKPANLFLARRPDGNFALKILDFGISKRLVDSATKGLTNPGASLGSPWYMSPEQMLSASLVDQRADIWSLGVLLFELLTKEYPFAGESVPQVCASVLTSPAPAPSSHRPDLDPALDAVVLRCLQKEPTLRYPDVAALADALQPFASRAVPSSGLALQHPQPSPSARPPSRAPGTLGSLAPLLAQADILEQSEAPRSRWSAVAVAVSALALGALLTVFGWPYARDHYGATTDWAAITLPGDPQLAADPPGGPVSSRRDAPRMLQIIDSTTSVPNRSAVTLGSVSGEGKSPVVPPAEVERRRERYENWLKEQGLVRIQKEAEEVKLREANPYTPQ